MSGLVQMVMIVGIVTLPTSDIGHFCRQQRSGLLTALSDVHPAATYAALNIWNCTLLVGDADSTQPAEASTEDTCFSTLIQPPRQCQYGFSLFACLQDISSPPEMRSPLRSHTLLPYESVPFKGTLMFLLRNCADLLPRFLHFADVLTDRL